ncbi:TM2 domain-containing protein [Erwinia sorbitola]|uniref:NINE protein n=1 Tax=Erwinia sorbitola TaxID=2681984 RepID=A0A6I6ELL9_9GAMM|nr:TM2 domain-containing protein [Erwinia sorbitola]MTD28900.1 NINE protein [Erwinia sorbitola]QGU89448.1 NINE protein [Erwinia sorbitola]
MSGMVFCRGCGKEVHSSALVCPNCGAMQNTGIGKKNKIAAALLALFLGSFGLHKFYLNRIGQGILYLVFCWTFIPALVALVEAIIYLCTSDEEFARRYG